MRRDFAIILDLGLVVLAGCAHGRDIRPRALPGDRVIASTPVACAIRRENAVRAEAGLGRRSDYGLASLAIGRRLVR